MELKQLVRHPRRKSSAPDAPADRRPELDHRSKKIMERLEGR